MKFTNMFRLSVIISLTVMLYACNKCEVKHEVLFSDLDKPEDILWTGDTCIVSSTGKNSQGFLTLYIGDELLGKLTHDEMLNPRGITQKGDTIFVVSDSTIFSLSLKTLQLNPYQLLKGANALNDIIVVNNSLFTTDFRGNQIFRLLNGEVKSVNMIAPNGLVWKNNQLYVGSLQKENNKLGIFTFDLTLDQMVDLELAVDGLLLVNNQIIGSNYYGAIFILDNNNQQKVLLSQECDEHFGDITMVGNTLYIPSDNKNVVYRLNDFAVE